MFKGLSLLLSFFYLKDPSIVNALHPNPNAKVKTMEQKSKKTKKREKNAKQKKTKAIPRRHFCTRTTTTRAIYARLLRTHQKKKTKRKRREKNDVCAREYVSRVLGRRFPQNDGDVVFQEKKRR
jgi:hypothetical protein